MVYPNAGKSRLSTLKRIKKSHVLIMRYFGVINTIASKIYSLLNSPTWVNDASESIKYDMTYQNSI